VVNYGVEFLSSFQGRKCVLYPLASSARCGREPSPGTAMSFGVAASASASFITRGRRGSEPEQFPEWLDDNETRDFNFVAELPAESLWIRSEHVRKRTADDTLAPRRIVITDEALYIAHESNDMVLDEILLSDIVQANAVETKSHLSHESRPFGGRAPNNTGCDFIIVASVDGKNHGRAYQMRCSNKAEAEDFVKFLLEKAREARERENSPSTFERYQASVDKWYSCEICQGFVAVLIFASFVANVIELEMDPGDANPALKQSFFSADLFFTAMFVVELLVNIFVNWFWPFWRDYWNIFDFVIVMSSVVSVAIELSEPSGDDNGLVNSLRLIRILRAFRVMRLFGRLESIRKIVSALGSSLIPVVNAFVIVFLIAAVYAIVGVNIFQSSHAGFGTWSKALYTMFTVTTMDGWQELVVMPMIASQKGSKTVPESLLTVFFFVTFVTIVVWTMLPVVVAELLEKFSNASHEEEHNLSCRKMRNSGMDKMQHNTLDPVFELLSHYSTDLDLSQKIRNMFKVMVGDNAEVETINFQDMATGLHSKKWFQRIHLSREDYDSFTCSGSYGDMQGNMNLKEFEAAMCTQLKRYGQRQVAKQQFACQMGGQAQNAAMLLSMKLLHMDMLACSRAVRDPQDPTLMQTSTAEKARKGSSRPPPTPIGGSRDAPILPYSKPRPVARLHAVDEVSEIESVLDGPSQTRSLNHEPPQFNTQLDMRKEMENRVDPCEERMERIMVDLCASVSKMQRDLAATNQRIEVTSRQVEECLLGRGRSK